MVEACRLSAAAWTWTADARARMAAAVNFMAVESTTKKLEEVWARSRGLRIFSSASLGLNGSMDPSGLFCQDHGEMHAGGAFVRNGNDGVKRKSLGISQEAL